MPIKSKAQRRWLHAAEGRGDLPEGTAKRWEEETPEGKRLPERVKRKAKGKTPHKVGGRAKTKK